MTEQTQPTDAELIAFATEEQFLLFCDPDEFTDIARAVLAKWGTPAGAGEPLFWYRPVCGGEMYEGPFHTNSADAKNLRAYKPDEWKPLFTTPQPTQAQAGAVPLKYARLHAISLDYSDSEDECTGFRDGWRAAEKHHDIKGADHG